MKKRSKAKSAKPKKAASKKTMAKKSTNKKSTKKKSPAKKVTKRKPSFSAEEFIKKMERAYSAKLPMVYKKYLTERLYEKYPKVEMTGFIRGPYFLDFTDSDLSNTTELGWNSGIHDMDDCNWSQDYVGYVPLASMSHPKLKEGAKGFLVMKVSDPALPVLLFDYEGWTLYPLAASFGEFLKNLPNAKNETATSFCPWDEAADSDDDEPKNYWELQRADLEEGEHKAIWESSFETMKTDLPGTIKSLVQLLDSYPQNVVLHRSIVTLSQKNGDEKMALEYIERGLRLKPNCIFLLMESANQKITSGDLAGALKIAEQIETGLATSEDDERYNKSTIAAIRGLVAFHQGKKVEALKLLDEADDLSFLVSLAFDDFKNALKSVREK